MESLLSFFRIGTMNLPLTPPPATSPPLREREGVRGWCMGRRNLQNLDAHRGHEPDRHPSPCPLPARRGEGGRRPGEGRFMERERVRCPANGRTIETIQRIEHVLMDWNFILFTFIKIACVIGAV